MFNLQDYIFNRICNFHSGKKKEDLPFLSTLLLLKAIKLSILFFIGVTWVGATVGIGTGILTLVAAPAVIVGAAVVGGVVGGVFGGSVGGEAAYDLIIR